MSFGKNNKEENENIFGMPRIEKEGIKSRHFIYIIVICICIFSIGIGVYFQFFREEKMGLIVGSIIGTNKEIDSEYKKLKENFINIFNNEIQVENEYKGKIKKIRENEDIIFDLYNKENSTDNYTVKIHIPVFNLNTETAKEFNQDIKKNFIDKVESIITSTNKKNIIYNVKYKAYINEDILSLVILAELKEENSSQRMIIRTYNYNLKENKKVTIKDLIDKKDINQEYANSKIKEEIDASQEQNVKLSELGYDANIRKSNSSIYKIKNAEEFFMGEDEYLYIIYPYGNSENTSETDIVIFR